MFSGQISMKLPCRDYIKAVKTWIFQAFYLSSREERQKTLNKLFICKCSECSQPEHVVAGEYHVSRAKGVVVFIKGSKKVVVFHDLLNCESFASRRQILRESMDSRTAPFWHPYFIIIQSRILVHFNTLKIQTLKWMLNSFLF